MTSFDITWRDGAYYVSVPNYKGGRVYTSECVERLVTALEFIRDGYDNQDVNHVDFRVKAYQVARDVLTDLISTPNT